MTQRARACAARVLSAGQRTAGRPARSVRRPSRRGRAASASEGLADADRDAERRVAVALVQRQADIESRRAEAGVVAHPDAGAHARRELREIGQGVEVGRAGIEKDHGAERLADALAELDAAFDDTGATQRIVEGVARARTLVAEAPHLAAAAGIEKL